MKVNIGFAAAYGSKEYLFLCKIHIFFNTTYHTTHATIRIILQQVLASGGESVLVLPSGNAQLVS